MKTRKHRDTHRPVLKSVFIVFYNGPSYMQTYGTIQLDTNPLACMCLSQHNLRLSLQNENETVIIRIWIIVDLFSCISPLSCKRLLTNGCTIYGMLQTNSKKVKRFNIMYVYESIVFLYLSANIVSFDSLQIKRVYKCGLQSGNCLKPNYPPQVHGYKNKTTSVL